MQADESWQSYLIWLTERGLAFPYAGKDLAGAGAEGFLAEPVPAPCGVRLRLAALSTAPLTPDETALLHKMILAMGLGLDECAVWAGAELPVGQPKLPAELILVLGREPLEQLGLGGAPQGTIVAHPWASRGLLPLAHPRELIRQPSAKRQAWAALQVGMRCLGLASPA